MYDYRIQLSVGQHGTSLLPPRDDYGCRESDAEGKIESPGPQFFFPNHPHTATLSLLPSYFVTQGTWRHTIIFSQRQPVKIPESLTWG